MNSNLPPNWSWVKLVDVCEITMGQSPPSSTYNTKEIGLPFFQGKAEFTELYPEVRKWCSKPKKLAEAGDILLSVRAPVGSTNIANQTCCIGRGLTAIRYPDCNKYIFYFFRFVEIDLDKLGTGTTFKAISSKTLNELKIPLPPLPEQKKIVAKIEELFSELDNGIEQLKKAKQQLKTYRQAVLSWAFSGRLLRKDDIFRQRNSKPKDVIFSGKAAEPEVGYNGNGLPEGWKWVRLGEVTENYDGKRIPLSKAMRAKRKGDFRYYGATGIIDLVDNYLFDGKYLLVGEDGANLLSKSRDLAFIVEGKFWVNNHAHVLKSKNETSLNFLAYFINSLNLEKFVSGSAQPKLTQANLNRIPIPHPAIREQHQIVSEIESRFSVADKLEQTIDENLKKAETLRQSILKKAFEGKLIEVKEEHQKEIKKFQIIQIVGAIINNLEGYRIFQGEMIIAKYLYLFEKLYKVKTNFKYQKWHFGPYDPQIKKILAGARNYFSRKGKSGFEYYILRNKQLLFKYDNKSVEKINSFFPELFDLFSVYKKVEERNHKIELLATVCKIIEDEKTSEKNIVWLKMYEWKTDVKETGYYNKSEKFKKEETMKCVDFIIKQGWDKKLIEN